MPTGASLEVKLSSLYFLSTFVKLFSFSSFSIQVFKSEFYPVLFLLRPVPITHIPFGLKNQILT